MIRAGDASRIAWTDRSWIFLDVGFSADARTSGLIIDDEEPECLRISDAAHRIVDKIARSKGETNLLIEAPLSVCFSPSGNPTGRSIEKEDGKTRYWYIGAGCAVMVAALYL